MTRLATYAAAVLIVTTPAGVVAQGVQAVCATYADLQTVSSFALPSTIDAIQKKCRSSLDAKAFLRTSGAALATRLRASAVSWDEASPAFTRLSKLALGSNGGEFASGSVVDQLVSSGVTDAFENKACGQVDAAVGALAQLPPQRLVDFLATLFVAASGETGLPMCKAG